MAWLTETTCTIMLGVLIALLVIVLVYVLVLYTQMRQLRQKYNLFMRGEDGKTLERKLATEVRELRELGASISAMGAAQENLSRVQHAALQQVGFVQYNAFAANGQQDSFSLTMLDGRGNGVTVSAISGSEETRVYAKEIRVGRYLSRPSREEEESLARALEQGGGPEKGTA